MAGRKGAMKIMHGVKISPEPVHKGWQRLKVGKWYGFTRITENGKPMAKKKRNDDGKVFFRGKVVREYKSWYLVDCGKYKTGVHKACIGLDWRVSE